MPKFRKKPLVVTAVQLKKLAELHRVFPESAKWVAANNVKEGVRVIVPTLEGSLEAHEGDWIIQGVAGEYYPCRDDIFKTTYEPVPTDNGIAPPWTGPSI